MTITPEARTRLAKAMDDRRLELGLRWQEVAERGGISLKSLYSARTGTRSLAPLTQHGIETGLQWAPRSVQAVLSGGEPVPLETAGTGPPGSAAARSIELEMDIELFRATIRARLAGLAEQGIADPRGEFIFEGDDGDPLGVGEYRAAGLAAAWRTARNAGLDIDEAADMTAQAWARVWSYQRRMADRRSG